MKHEWILDVLADLEAFAQANDLNALAEQLDETRLFAASEIVLASDMAGLVVNGDDASPRTHSRSTRASTRA
ncbi:hypothetical protein SAMN05444000_104117 [Shimia gijangensis]|uniref:Uncharacterized protein n=1 Tax=Shimia gijangensis TaxID=1470563 RepID=A0A1M6FMV9_9RHOB|nr:hypothetical protein SAMN05444000_104117 [Shimia gijangensis]